MGGVWEDVVIGCMCHVVDMLVVVGGVIVWDTVGDIGGACWQIGGSC